MLYPCRKDNTSNYPTTKNIIIGGLLVIALLNSLITKAAIFNAEDYGVVGDGITDDGLAIQAALTDMMTAEGSNTLVFQANKHYFASNISGIYLFQLTNTSDIEIDANGSTFLLDAGKYFLRTENAENIKIRNLSIDYKPLPFFEGTVIAKNQSGKYIDVQISPEFEMPPLGGPTHAEDEQTYFGHVWYNGPNSLMAHHYYVTDMQEAYAGSSKYKQVRVSTSNAFGGWNHITTNSTKVSLPVRGIAHKGGNEVLNILESTNVYFENINVWSAPWFVFGLTRCKGEVELRNVRIKPKDGTNRILSSWRDGIHVKSNYAKLLFEDCYLEGMGDDAFNIATFMSRVKTVTSDKQITINQVYPLSIVPYNEGDKLVVYDIAKGKMLGRANVKGSVGFYQPTSPASPNISIVLDSTIADMSTACVVWNESSANPNTTLKGCTILQSCRFQSSVTIDSCDIKALSWFRCETLEGPMSSDVIVKNSKLAVGRGNGSISTAFSTYMTYNGDVYEPTVPPLTNVLLQNNQIDGDFNLEYCDNVAIINNTFSASTSTINVKKSGEILFRDNSFGSVPLTSVGQINCQDAESENKAKVEVSDNADELNIMQPFAHWTAILSDGTHYRYHTLPDELKPQNKTDVVLDDSIYKCYQIIVPPSASGIAQVQLNLYPTVENKNIYFWSHTKESGISIEAKAIYHNKGNTVIYTAQLSSEGFAEHNLQLPEDLDPDADYIEISFKAEENITTSKILYISNSEFKEPKTHINTSGYRSDAIKVFPNPTSDVLIIDAVGKIKWKVYTLTGQQLKVGRGNIVQLSELQSGSYLVAVKNNKGDSATIKFLKH